MRRRLFKVLGEERGFTLVEMLVTMMVMLLVMFALYSVFDMSIRVFSFGSDKIEAVENARLGLEKMEREIRGAYPYTGDGGSGLFPGYGSNTSDRITFGNDRNGDGSINLDSEQFTYGLSDGSPPALSRNGEPVIEAVKPDGLTFTFLKNDGGTPANESEVGRVLIKLEIDVNPGREGGTQELTAMVDLRNRP